jgi:hypothetical protein
MMIKRVLLCGALVLALLGISQPAMAWAGFVHAHICDVAYEQLSPEAKRMVQSLTRGEFQFEKEGGFGAACVWPDEVRSTTHRSTFGYHFINVPRGKTYNARRDCAAFDCTTQAVLRYMHYLSDAKASMRQRAEALRFVGHFVADLHQPLHVGHKEDRGGNDIFVMWQNETKPKRLHAVWDGALPAAMGLLPLQSVRELALQAPEAQRLTWQDGDINAWAAESFQQSQQYAYRDAAGQELQNGQALGAAYIQHTQAIVEQRIQQSVWRLVQLLEQAASSAQ